MLSFITKTSSAICYLRTGSAIKSYVFLKIFRSDFPSVFETFGTPEISPKKKRDEIRHIEVSNIFRVYVNMRVLYSLFSGLSLTLCVPLYFAKSLRLYPFFSHFLGVGLLAYFSNHSPFSREHNFIGLNELSSLVCWCTVIHHHRPQGTTLFQRVRWDFMSSVCSEMCAHSQDLLFSVPSEKNR